MSSLEVSESSTSNLFSVRVGIKAATEAEITEKVISMVRHLLTLLCLTDGHWTHPDSHVWSPAVRFEVQRMNSLRDSVEHVIMGPTPDRLGGSVSMLNAFNTSLFEAVALSLPDDIQAKTLYNWQRLVNVCVYKVQDRVKPRTRGKPRQRESLTVYGITTANNPTVHSILGDISDDRKSNGLHKFSFLGSKRTAFYI